MPEEVEPAAQGSSDELVHAALVASSAIPRPSVESVLAFDSSFVMAHPEHGMTDLVDENGIIHIPIGGPVRKPWPQRPIAVPEHNGHAGTL